MKALLAAVLTLTFSSAWASSYFDETCKAKTQNGKTLSLVRPQDGSAYFQIQDKDQLGVYLQLASADKYPITTDGMDLVLEVTSEKNVRKTTSQEGCLETKKVTSTRKVKVDRASSEVSKKYALKKGSILSLSCVLEADHLIDDCEAP